MMYDFMGKEILDPESTPERVNELLSLLLKQKVEIIEVLPNEGTRLADESTLLIKDIFCSQILYHNFLMNLIFL